MARKNVFNARKHRLLRRRVPIGENLISLGLGVALVGTVAAVFSMRADFDPTLRDLPLELLTAERPVIEIYTPPLKRWVEPGSETIATAARTDFGLYPASITDDGWYLADGRVRKFDATNLYEKINGEAEKFIKLGFVSMHYAVLRAPTDGSTDELSVELYDQGGVAGSAGVFSAHGAARRAVEQAGEVNYFMTSIGVIGRVGPYFFRAAGNQPTESIRAKALQLVNALAGLVMRDGSAESSRGGAIAETNVPQIALAARSGATPPPRSSETVPLAMRLLRDGLGVPESAIAYKATKAFQLDFATEFWFAGVAPKDSDSNAQGFLHVGESSETAAAILEQLLEEQAFEHETVSQTAEWTVMRHEFLKTYFAVGQRGKYLLGAYRMNDSDALSSILSKLEAAIPPE